MGGVCEEQICLARAILAFMLMMHENCMIEVERILNSRRLTVENINDPGNFQPLSPANISTIKSKIVIPQPGKFLRPDLYFRRR